MRSIVWTTTMRAGFETAKGFNKTVGQALIAGVGLRSVPSSHYNLKKKTVDFLKQQGVL